jgi:hypothetical protein
MNPKCATNYDLWVRNQSTFPKIRFKTADIKGKVVLIQLEGSGEWTKPEEWANIHIQNLLHRVHDDGNRLLDILPPASVLMLISGALPKLNLIKPESVSGLKDERDDLANSLAGATRSLEAEVLKSIRLQERMTRIEEENGLLRRTTNSVMTIIRENMNAVTPKAIRDIVKQR